MPGSVSGGQRLGAWMFLLFALVVGGVLADCDCNGPRVNLVATEKSQLLTSPGYPNNYPNDCYCQWLIKSDKEFVKFTIDVVSLERTEPDRLCELDTVTFYDGYASGEDVLQSLCFTPNSEQEATFESTSKYVYIIFRSDSQRQRQGFRVNFQAGGYNCGGAVTTLEATNSYNILTSPNYPDHYPRDCVSAWRITSDKDVVALTIEDMELETSSDNTCPFDDVKIFDGSDFNADVLTTMCTLPASESGRTFLSRSKDVYILFKSDSHVQKSGFNISFQAQDCTFSTGLINLEATGSYKTLMSPGYPMDYPSDSNIEWVITSGHNAVRLTIEAVDLESSTDCNYDFVEIHDGISADAPMLSKLCTFSDSRTVVSTSQNVYIRFKSDSGVERSGFRIGYQAESKHQSVLFNEDIPDLIATANYQTVTADSCTTDSFCEWHMTSDMDVVNINVHYLRQPHDCDDHLEIYDGDSTRRKVVLQLCALPEIYPTFASTSKTVYIRYNRNAKTDGFGIRFEYQGAYLPDLHEPAHSDGECMSGKPLTMIVVLIVYIVVITLSFIVCIIYRKRQTQPGIQKLTKGPWTTNIKSCALFCGNSKETKQESILKPPPYSTVVPPYFDEEANKDITNV